MKTTENMQKEKKTFKQQISGLVNYCKKHKTVILIVIAVLLAFIIVTSVYSFVVSSKVKSQIENKVFIYEDSHFESYELFAFKNGYIAQETWYAGDSDAVGNVTTFDHKYRIVASIFSNNIEIQAKYPHGWINVQSVYLDNNDVVHIYSYSENDVANWEEISLDEIDSLRSVALCAHELNEPVITKQATCSDPGEKTQSCKKCTYKEVQPYYVNHNFIDKVCTICGYEKVAEKSDIEPNTWYTYSDVLYFQNIKLINAFPVSNGKGMMVSYYFVCQHCHIVDDTMQASVPENNYDIEKVYSCDECGKYTTVKIKID